VPRRLVIAALLPPLLIVAGVAGYVTIEGWPLFDALYMAVITLTTIGFAEVHPLTDAGRAFTMALALSGIFTMFFAASEVLRSWASGELKAILSRKRQEKTMNQLENHLIVCGYGRMGRLVCREFSEAGVPYVVIDSNESALAHFELTGGVSLHGDATSDDCLRRAGIARARALVTVVPADADNLFITMSARLLNERLRIVARAEDDASSAKLMRAGASQVISPYVLGGARVAQAILRPNVHEFIDVTTRSGHLALQLEEVVVTAGSALDGGRVEGNRLDGLLDVIVVAVKAHDAPMRFNPGRGTVAAGDTLVMLGARRELDRAERMAKA
jgi:voltage-gated potassium channel